MSQIVSGNTFNKNGPTKSLGTFTGNHVTTSANSFAQNPPKTGANAFTGNHILQSANVMAKNQPKKGSGNPWLGINLTDGGLGDDLFSPSPWGVNEAGSFTHFKNLTQGTINH